MPDDRIYDAINLFKYSATGQGTANIGGDGRYRARYRGVASRVLAKLWELWQGDEIGWANLRPTLVGDSLANRAGWDIRANNSLEPSTNSTTYATAAHQGRLAASSCNIVHEAVHLAHQINSYPEEEVLCRTIQLFYFRELTTGRTYRSRVTGSQLTARYTPTTPFFQTYQNRLVRLASRDLIDNVFNIDGYRRDLETAPTAAFVARSFAWWNGLRNRWPSTRGYYLRSLASQSHDYAHKILEILESIPAARWPAARSCAGNLDRIRQGLARNYHIYNNPFARRISRVQETLGDNFGINAR